MKYYLRFVTLSIVLLIVSNGCKGQKKIENRSDQLEHIDDSNKREFNIEELIDAKAITIICIRHAEKKLDSGNPTLTVKGNQRANDFALLLANVKVDAIYSSDYKRTEETAQPLSNQTQLQILHYNPHQLDDLKNTILSNHQNEVVVVVGHSNSTPELVNVLLSEEKFESFDESDYDNIFVVSLGAEVADGVHLLEYGEVSGAVDH